MSSHDFAARATPAAGVAIFDAEGALLLGKHAHDGRWATFGGAIESGEDTRHAALREVVEETGLVLDQIEMLGVFGGTPAYTVHYPDGSQESYEVTMFCSINRNHEQLSADGAEILETAWVSDDEVGDIELAPDMAEIVPAAYRWFRCRSRAATGTARDPRPAQPQCE